MLEIAVIGVGAMGRNHCRVLGLLPDVRLAAVVDIDPVAAADVAAQHGARSVADIDELPPTIDAAIVATPTQQHEADALALISRGVDVLIEKPLAPSAEAAMRVVDAATAAGRVLMVGHIEQYNPVVMEMLEIIGEPLYVEARRIGPYTDRIPDGVTTDLMIHDLDLIRAIVKSDLTEVMSVVKTIRGTREDLSVALLKFENGAVANVVASRVGQDKVRQVMVTQEDRVVRADLIRQDLTVHRVQEVSFGDDAAYRESGVVEVPFLRRRGEPLYLELEHFVACVRERRPPITDGQAGVDAIRMVERVLVATSVAKGGQPW